MQSGWIRAFVLVAVAALLGNAQCYGNCSGIPCGSTHKPSDGCHEHQKSSHEDARCPHQHSEFASPEVGAAKISLAIGTVSVPVLAVDSAADFTESRLLVHANTGSPPGAISSTISVLRI